MTLILLKRGTEGEAVKSSKVSYAKWAIPHRKHAGSKEKKDKENRTEDRV